MDFCDFLSPTPEEKAKRDSAIQSVFEVIKHIWPHCQVWLSFTCCIITFGLSFGFTYLNLPTQIRNCEGEFMKTTYACTEAVFKLFYLGF